MLRKRVEVMSLLLPPYIAFYRYITQLLPWTRNVYICMYSCIVSLTQTHIKTMLCVYVYKRRKMFTRDNFRTKLRANYIIIEIMGGSKHWCLSFILRNKCDSVFFFNSLHIIEKISALVSNLHVFRQCYDIIIRNISRILSRKQQIMEKVLH